MSKGVALELNPLPTHRHGRRSRECRDDNCRVLWAWGIDARQSTATERRLVAAMRPGYLVDPKHGTSRDFVVMVASRARQWLEWQGWALVGAAGPGRGGRYALVRIPGVRKESAWE